MKHTPRNPNRMSVKTDSAIKKYILAKNERDNRLWKMVGQSLITFFNGSWISSNEFEEHFPILKQGCLLTNLDNPNIKNNYTK